MPQNSTPPPKAKVVIGLHQLYIEVEHHASYPDQMTDLSSRAYELFQAVLEKAKEAQCDIRDFSYSEWDSDEEEDAE
jgi:hypothetical protein